jgi:Tat protein translocase TatB subunit
VLHRVVATVFVDVKRYIGSLPPRLALVFNIEGSELIFLLLIALVVLGPEKLPEAVRKFTKGYAEFKKMASGFQGEMRSVLEEPMRELRDTADAVRAATKFDLDPDAGATSNSPGATPGVSEIKREKGLNFGSAAARPTPTPRREPGLNFGSANPRQQTRISRADATDAGDLDAADLDGADVSPEATTAGLDSSAPAVEDTTE